MSARNRLTRSVQNLIFPFYKIQFVQCSHGAPKALKGSECQPLNFHHKKFISDNTMKDKVKTTRNTLSKIVTAISQVSSSDEFLFLSLVRSTSSRTACNNRLFLFIICSIQLLQVHDRTLLSILFLSQPPFCDEEPPEMEKSTHTYTFKNIH